MVGATTGFAVAGRNWRSPGYRTIGLYRVSSRNGGPVGICASIIGVYFDQASQAMAKSVFGARIKRQQDRTQELEPELKALKRRHRDDSTALQEAMTEFYATNGLNVWTGCGWLAAGQVVWDVALLVGSREGRTVRDRLTGTTVIQVPKEFLGR